MGEEAALCFCHHKCVREEVLQEQRSKKTLLPINRGVAFLPKTVLRAPRTSRERLRDKSEGIKYLSEALTLERRGRKSGRKVSLTDTQEKEV